MLVQHQLWRSLWIRHQADVLPKTFALARVWAQVHPRGSALLSMPDDSTTGHASLHPRKEESVQVQQEPVWLTNAAVLREQHRDVVEVPESRWASHSLQSVENKQSVVVFQGDLKEVSLATS